MKNSFAQLLNNIDDRMPVDGTGGGRRTPVDGTGGGRGRTPVDGTGGGR